MLIKINYLALAGRWMQEVLFIRSNRDKCLSASTSGENLNKNQRAASKVDARS